MTLNPKYLKGCVLGFDFNERSGNKVYDLSGNNNDGTIYGAQWVRGKIGYALKFDGVDDYVDCGNDTSLGLNILTYMAWVKTSETAPKDAIGTRIITNWRSRESTKITLKMYGDYPELMWHNGTGFVYARATTKITDDKWHFLVGTYDGSTGKIYVDGKLEDTNTEPLTTENYYQTLVGTYRLAEGYFNGIIDYVRIFNRALTLKEILEHYYYGIMCPAVKIPSPYVWKPIPRVL